MDQRGDGRGRLEKGVFRRLLVGFDGSDASMRAVQAAQSLAADIGGEVHVIRVVHPAANVETNDERQANAEAERQNLSTLLTKAGAGVTSHVVVDDDPAGAISAYAAEHGFDLIVVGTHGRERVVHGGIGSSLEALLRDHSCPVLVV